MRKIKRKQKQAQKAEAFRLRIRTITAVRKKILESARPRTVSSWPGIVNWYKNSMNERLYNQMIERSKLYDENYIPE